MSDLDFNSLVNTRAGDVTKPVPVPVGHYNAMFSGAMTPHKAKTGNVAMRFPVKLMEAGADVDADALQTSGGIPDRVFNVDFWMSPDAQFRFTDFCKSCGVFDDNLTLVQMAERLIEEQVLFTVEVTHQPNDKDPDSPYARVDNLVGMEAA